MNINIYNKNANMMIIQTKRQHNVYKNNVNRHIMKIKTWHLTKIYHAKTNKHSHAKATLPYKHYGKTNKDHPSPCS